MTQIYYIPLEVSQHISRGGEEERRRGGEEERRRGGEEERGKKGGQIII